MHVNEIIYHHHHYHHLLTTYCAIKSQFVYGPHLECHIEILSANLRNVAYVWYGAWFALRLPFAEPVLSSTRAFITLRFTCAVCPWTSPLIYGERRNYYLVEFMTRASALTLYCPHRWTFAYGDWYAGAATRCAVTVGRENSIYLEEARPARENLKLLSLNWIEQNYRSSWGYAAHSPNRPPKGTRVRIRCYLQEIK